MSGISARLDRHWDRIAACFSAGRQTPNLRAGLLWQQLSGLLESQSIRDEAAMASRNQQIDEQEEAISRYDRRIDHLNEMLAERDQQVSRQTDTVTERDEHIHHLNAMLAERDRQGQTLSRNVTNRLIA
jgi:uncharacterized coiled-coil protein SlyX